MAEERKTVNEIIDEMRRELSEESDQNLELFAPSLTKKTRKALKGKKRKGSQKAKKGKKKKAKKKAKKPKKGKEKAKGKGEKGKKGRG